MSARGRVVTLAFALDEGKADKESSCTELLVLKEKKGGESGCGSIGNPQKYP